jgi:hypothetical protein
MSLKTISSSSLSVSDKNIIQIWKKIKFLGPYVLDPEFKFTLERRHSLLCNEYGDIFLVARI